MPLLFEVLGIFGVILFISNYHISVTALTIYGLLLSLLTSKLASKWISLGLPFKQDAQMLSCSNDDEQESKLDTVIAYFQGSLIQMLKYQLTCNFEVS